MHKHLENLPYKKFIDCFTQLQTLNCQILLQLSNFFVTSIYLIHNIYVFNHTFFIVVFFWELFICPSSWQSVHLPWQTHERWTLHADFSANFFIPAMLIDFCHFVPLSLILTIAWGHMASTKQNLLASFSHTVFI